MDLRKLKKLIDLVEESGIAELEITEGEEKVRIVKHPVATAQAGQALQHIIPAASSATRKARAKDLDLDDEDDSELPEGEVVKAPLVGTFYRSATPSAEPFVDVGSVVKEGDTLCAIESMKQQNELRSPYAGTVKAILVGNGEAVEFGEPLFVIA